ncbi:hypothetical protein Tco_0542215 [Tanacetum coccineum]
MIGGTRWDNDKVLDTRLIQLITTTPHHDRQILLWVLKLSSEFIPYDESTFDVSLLAAISSLNSLVLFEVSVFSAEPDEGKHYNIKAYTNKDDPPEEVWREEWHQCFGERYKNDKKEGPVDGISVEVLFLVYNRDPPPMEQIQEPQKRKVRAMVKPGCSQDVAKAALSAMSSVTDILSVMSSPSNSTT